MDGLESNDLVIRVDRSAPTCLRLDWLGRSDSRNPVEIIGPFFEQVLAEATGLGRLIDIHFEALEYFNSSTIATVIHLINSARKAMVLMRIHYDAGLRWQALAFDALRRAVTWSAQGKAPQVEFLEAKAPKR